MRTKLFILSFFIVLPLTEVTAYPKTECYQITPETIIFNVTKGFFKDWREVSRNSEEIRSTVEWMPLDQTDENWKNVLSILFVSQAVISPESLFDHLQDKVFSTYPRKDITWRILEKNPNDLLYEWILHTQHKNTLPLHEIVRVFFTKNGYNSVSITYRNSEMSLTDREQWISLFKNYASVISFDEAANSEGLSMVSKLSETVVLGPEFENWAAVRNVVYNHGSMETLYVPSTEVGKYIIECFEIMTMPTTQAANVEDLFEGHKKVIQNNFPKKKIKFTVLKQNQNEIIYSYSHPRDNLLLNAVVRSFTSDHGFFTASYKRGLKGNMEQKEILKRQNQLETIKFDN